MYIRNQMIQIKIPLIQHEQSLRSKQTQTVHLFHQNITMRQHKTIINERKKQRSLFTHFS